MKTYFYILYVQKAIVNEWEDDVEEIFYVGRTYRDLKRRLKEHKYEAKRRDNVRANYILTKMLEGRQIGIKEIYTTEEVDRFKISLIETELIEAYKAYGYPLVNRRDGLSGGHIGHGSRVVWTEELLASLGKVRDEDIGNILGCTGNCVGIKRRFLGIPSMSRVNWTPEMLACLGVMTDKAIGEKFGLGETTVKRKRDKLGIKPMSYRTGTFQNPQTLPWTQKELEMLGKYSDAEIARIKKCDPETVRKKRISLAIPAYTN